MKKEDGSVLFYILIAVALLAALTYAVIQSNRGSLSQISDEKAKLVADDMLNYASVVSNAVAQLRLRGIKDADLCFDDAGWGGANYPNANCTDETARIFGVKGGGITWRSLPAEAGDPASSPDYLWHIYSDNEIQDVGTTCGGAACSDLILEADGLNQKICEKLNELLGVTPADTAPPVDSAFGITKFNGTYGYAQTIGDEAGGAALAGKTAACFQKTANPPTYAFFKVLIAR